MHEEKIVWRIGVQLGCLEKAKCVVYWDTRAAAEAVREEALIRGGIELEPTVSHISVEHGSMYARSIGASKAEIADKDFNVIEWWLV
jgi:hypothetical protein